MASTAPPPNLDDTLCKTIEAVGLLDAGNVQAVRFLEDLQRAPIAWDVCLHILANTHLDSAVAPGVINLCVIASTILHAKVQSEGGRQGENFVSSLVAIMKRFLAAAATAPGVFRAVLAKLSQTLAASAVQIERWQNALDTVVNTFNNGESEAAVLLRVLGSMPQECASARLKCKPSRRTQFSTYLSSSSSRVLILLENIWTVLGSGKRGPVFECVALWVQHDAMSSISFARHTMLCHDAFETCAVEALHSSSHAHDTLINCLEQHSRMNLRDDLCELFLPHLPCLWASVSFNAPTPEHLRQSVHSATTLAEIMKASTHLVLRPAQASASSSHVMELYHNNLQSMSHLLLQDAPPAVSQSAVSFWTDFFKDVKQVSVQDPSLGAALCEVCQRVVAGMLKISEYPCNWEDASLFEDERLEFHLHRELVRSYVFVCIALRSAPCCAVVVRCVCVVVCYVGCGTKSLHYMLLYSVALDSGCL
jgi:hypothetical protein